MKDFPESDLIRAIEIDPEDPVASLRPLLQDRARQFEEVVSQVRFGRLPYGFGMDVLGRPYSLWLLTRAAGVICAVSADQAERTAEVEAAEAAVGGSVVVDLSASVVAILGDLDWWQGDHFESALIPESQVDDIRAALDDLRLVPDGNIAWDEALDEPVRWETTESSHEQLRRRVQKLGDFVEEHLAPAKTAAKPDEGLEVRFGPWFDSIRLAREKGVALYADDLGMRRLARSLGLQAFGTHDLLRALGQTREVPDDFVQLSELALMRSFATDLPVNAANIHALAAESDYAPGPALLPLARPVTWSDPELATGFFASLMALLSATDRLEHAPYWLAAAVEGAGLAAPVGAQVKVAGFLLASAIAESGANRESIPELVSAAREATQYRLKLDTTFDPLAEAVPFLRSALTDAVPDGQVGGVVLSLFEGLPVEDRSLVARSLLTPSTQR